MENTSVWHQLAEAFDTQNLQDIVADLPMEQQQTALQRHFDQKITEKENYYYSDNNPLIKGEQKIDRLVLDVKTKLAQS